MRRFFAGSVLLLILGPAARPAEKQPVTVEALVAEEPPAPGPPVWAPSSDRVAFTQENVLWRMDLPSGRRHKLLDLKELDKAAIESHSPEPYAWRNRRVHEEPLQWLPSGKELLVKQKGDLFLIDAATGKWRQLTRTAEDEEDPKVSPDGQKVSFVRNAELHLVEIASGEERRLTRSAAETIWNGRLDWVYPEELEIGTAYWWSPDSESLAYLQFDVTRVPVFPHTDLTGERARFEPQRYPKAGDPNPEVRVGVVAAAGGETQWMNLGEPRGSLIGRLHWLPDGRRMGIVRLNRVQNRLDVLLADRETGQATTLLTETDPYWVNLSDAFYFFETSGRLLWSSERDGFRHFYLYDLDGKMLRRLTDGEWLVEDLVGVDEKNGLVYYTSTEETPLERHLYRVGLDGSGKQKLTGEPGVHTIAMAPDFQWYLDSFSNLQTAPRRIFRQTASRTSLVYDKGNTGFAETRQVLPTEILTVAAPDGAKLYARLVRPPHFDPAKKYPAVVMVYGGPHAQQVRNAWEGNKWDQALAQQGFVIWQLDNRGSGGRGHAWESVLYHHLGVKELEDQRLGVEHLVSMGFVDPARIGLYGWSYGGYMTLYSLLKAPDLFRAGVAGAPVTDWQLYDTIYTERYMGLPSENREGYKESSPVNFSTGLKADLLIVHNLGDDNVHFQNTVHMTEELEKAGRYFETVFYPQKTHGVTGPLRAHLYQTMIRFFERSLERRASASGR